MAEINSELVYEILKSLQREVSEVKSNIIEVKSELSAIRGHLNSVHQDVHNIYGVLGRQDVHLERIERRLELSDAPNLT
jgi:hypothetical protein